MYNLNGDTNGLNAVICKKPNKLLKYELQIYRDIYLSNKLKQCFYYEVKVNVNRYCYMFDLLVNHPTNFEFLNTDLI